MGNAFAYFFVGFFSALVVIELTDGEPTKKVNYYTNDQYMVRYIYNPFPSGYYHHRMRPDTFNAQRPNNGGSSASLKFEYNNDGTAEKSSGAGDWASTSDKRLKKNIEDLNVDALDVINSLRPIEFNWKEEELHGNPKDSNGKTYGFLADEVESVMPQLVFESELSEESADREYVDEDGMAKKTELGHMASIYIKAIQQLSEKNEALEKRIKELEN